MKFRLYAVAFLYYCNHAMFTMFSVHAREFEHNIDWINAKILKVENNYSKRLVSEAWFINSRPNVMNRSDGDKLPQVYQILF